MIGIKETGLFAGVALGFALGGCNSLDKRADASDGEPRLMIPVDERAALTAPVTPLAISGGTLSVLWPGGTVTRVLSKPPLFTRKISADLKRVTQSSLPRTSTSRRSVSSVKVRVTAPLSASSETNLPSAHAT